MKIKLNKKMIIFILFCFFIAPNSVLLAANQNNWTETQTTKANKTNKWNIWKQNWEKAEKIPIQIVLTPGKNETELNFAWYSKEEEPTPKLKIGTSKTLTDAKLLKISSTNATNGFHSNKATVKNLLENTTYYYSYTINKKWQPITPIQIQSVDKYSFIFVGDPQIGSSYTQIPTNETNPQSLDRAVQNDSFNWNITLNTALQTNPNCSFLISAGDQIQSNDKQNPNKDYNQTELEYTGLFTPDILRSLPIASSIGNHDSPNKNYSYHFNNPNTGKLGSTTAGSDYYFTYGNTLFLMLNSNNLNTKEHQQFIEKAIKEHPFIIWKIVTMHHDIYGSGKHASQPDTLTLKKKLIPIFEKNKIDIVLSGHDHSYARSLLLKNNVQDKTGILYITASSSTGSKYYNLLEKKPSYLEKNWQENVPTYSLIDITNTAFTISTYRVDTNTIIDKFILYKNINLLLIDQSLTKQLNKSFPAIQSKLYKKFSW